MAREGMVVVQERWSAAAHAGQPAGAGFDLLLLGHVLCALAALGTVAISGLQAHRLLGEELRGELSVPSRRYYTPGTNWAARVIYGVPVFGFALLAASKGAYGLDDVWVLTGLSLWVLAAGLAEAVLWPTERRVQAIVAARRTTDPPRLSAACRKVRRSAAAVLAVLVLATIIMFVRP